MNQRMEKKYKIFHAKTSRYNTNVYFQGLKWSKHCLEQVTLINSQRHRAMMDVLMKLDLDY